MCVVLAIFAQFRAFLHYLVYENAWKRCSGNMSRRKRALDSYEEGGNNCATPEFCVPYFGFLEFLSGGSLLGA